MLCVFLNYLPAYGECVSGCMCVYARVCVVLGVCVHMFVRVCALVYTVTYAHRTDINVGCLS